MRLVIVTVVHGRHQHLRRQLDGLARSSRPADGHVVVAVDDPDVPAVVAGRGVATVALQAGTPRLPVAAARNAGARAALARGADVLVFLDVDCIPGDQLLERYAAAAAAGPDALLSGPVAYLDPPPPTGYDLDALPGSPAHPARPVPPDGALVPADHRLFWSLSFAVTASAWRRVGGFCEQYAGYGGEDTDFGQLAARAGVGHVWVGGAWAYHQYHPSADPPVQHVDDILRNATLFHERWGWWPMTGWLDAFAARGLIRERAGGWESTAA